MTMTFPMMLKSPDAPEAAICRDVFRKAIEAAAGDDIDAVRGLFETIEPAALTEGEVLDWWLLLTECGLTESALGLSARIGEASGRQLMSDVAATSPVSEPRPEPDSDPLFDLALPSRAVRRPHTQLHETFLTWFGGRRDIYARQWHDERRNRSGYHPVEEPLTVAVVSRHLEGRLTIGQYLLFPDATVSFAVIDLDLAATALAELRAAEGEEASAVGHPALRAYLARLVDAGRHLGLPLWPEDSGGRGAHLWMFLSPRRPARAARALLAMVVSQAGVQPPEVNVEFFPKQERLGPRGLSSLVKLPLGIHQVSLRSCPLLDERLEPQEDPGVALERLRAVPDDVAAALLGRQLVALPAPELEPGESAPVVLPARPTPRSLAEALRAIVPGQPEREACEKMLEGCAALRQLVRKAFDQRKLAPAEARAVVYTLGLIGPSCRLADEVLATAQVPRRELDRARRGVSSPTGCRQLRALVPEAVGQCRCPGVRQAQPYATPALFAVGPIRLSAPVWKPFAPWVEEAPLEVADPLQSIAEWLRRIEQRLSRLEEKGT